MENCFSAKPKIGISACLLGQKVRYDGGDKRDDFLTEIFGRYVEWVPVCPEVEVGMGVPREAVHLTGSLQRPRMIAERSGRDWTREMEDYATQRVRSLQKMDLSGYLFKKDSPSCGMERVRVYGSKGAPARQGRGLFAAVLMQALPLLPVEEEGRLHDAGLRENFIERVFAYYRWQQLIQERKSVRALVRFHTRHKFLLMAHSESHYRQLGRIVAEAKKEPIGPVHEIYGRLFMQALAIHTTARKHGNVLEHMMGYFSEQLSAEERAELVELIADFRGQLIPLVVPLTLLRHYVKKYRIAYLDGQVYLEPNPKELMLRNHV